MAFSPRETTFKDSDSSNSFCPFHLSFHKLEAKWLIHKSFPFPIVCFLVTNCALLDVSQFILVLWSCLLYFVFLTFKTRCLSDLHPLLQMATFLSNKQHIFTLIGPGSWPRSKLASLRSPRDTLRTKFLKTKCGGGAFWNLLLTQVQEIMQFISIVFFLKTWMQKWLKGRLKQPKPSKRPL